VKPFCADCKAELEPGAYDTIYECAYDPPLTFCSACWRSREAHVRWEAHRGFPAARARQRRIEAALA
jgi:hypothetical protein